jgi:uncharacterized protein (DUF885 family)
MKTVHFLIVLLFCGAAAAQESWIERSNRHAAIVIESLGRFDPEQASYFGVERFDTAVFDLGPRRTERFMAATGELLKRLATLKQAERDARVAQDLEILIEAVERMRRTRGLEHRLLIPYFDVPEQVFQGLQALLDARNPEARHRNALERLRRYAGMEAGTTAFTELAQSRMRERFAQPGIAWPYQGEVRQHLGNCQRYSDGIAELFRERQLTGWESAHQRLAAQLREHCAWVEKTILPRARSSPTLPRELYADRLRNAGVDLEPEQAIRMGLFAFAEIRDEMARLAGGDYRARLRELKREVVPPERILALYRERLSAIEAIVKRERIVTLPDRAASIRLASEAESASIPAAYMNPPRLIGNRGERGEFVLPLTNPNARGRMDDFTCDAAAWTLTAHEARPGHELQFAIMVERGVSIARATFASNSTNTEGWALYAETIMTPHFPADGQLFALQLRLLRAARAFLDPMVNLGRMTPAAAQKFLMDELTLSEPMAQQEADRYAFKSPGQAVSYLYGYTRMRELRMKAELALGARFDQRAFHDLVLEQGLLPPRLLERAVLDQLTQK